MVLQWTSQSALAAAYSRTLCRAIRGLARTVRGPHILRRRNKLCTRASRSTCAAGITLSRAIRGHARYAARARLRVQIWPTTSWISLFANSQCVFVIELLAFFFPQSHPIKINHS